MQCAEAIPEAPLLPGEVIHAIDPLYRQAYALGLYPLKIAGVQNIGVTTWSFRAGDKELEVTQRGTLFDPGSTEGLATDPWEFDVRKRSESPSRHAFSMVEAKYIVVPCSVRHGMYMGEQGSFIGQMSVKEVCEAVGVGTEAELHSFVLASARRAGTRQETARSLTWGSDIGIGMHIESREVWQDGKYSERRRVEVHDRDGGLTGAYVWYDRNIHGRWRVTRQRFVAATPRGFREDPIAPCQLDQLVSTAGVALDVLGRAIADIRHSRRRTD